MQHTDTINSLVVIDAESGAHFEYEGPFSCTREAGAFEVTLPLDQADYASIHESTAEHLTERVGDLALTVVDGMIHASGRIDAADIVGEQLLIRVDDPTHGSTHELDIDPAEVRNE